MKIILHYQLQKDNVEEFLEFFAHTEEVKKHVKKSLFRFWLTAVLMMLIIFLVGEWQNPVVQIAEGIWALSLVLVPVFMPRYYRFVLKKTHRKALLSNKNPFILEKTKCTINEKGIFAENSYAKAQYQWNGFTLFKELNTLFILQLINRQYLLFPKKAFTKPEAAQFKKSCSKLKNS